MVPPTQLTGHRYLLMSFSPPGSGGQDRRQQTPPFQKHRFLDSAQQQGSDTLRARVPDDSEDSPAPRGRGAETTDGARGPGARGSLSGGEEEKPRVKSRGEADRSSPARPLTPKLQVLLRFRPQAGPMQLAG